MRPMRWWLVVLLLAGCSSPGRGFPPVDDGDAATQDDATYLPLEDAETDVVVEADLLVDASGPDGATGCAVEADGTPCKAAPDLCHADGVCKGGLCMAPTPHADGFNWKQGDDTARCCGGSPIYTSTNANCGACGIQCNAQNGESCAVLGGHYFCRGCTTNAGCWSKCCSLSFSPSSCAASDCKGSCDDTYCPKGTHCVLGNGVSSNYCSY